MRIFGKNVKDRLSVGGSAPGSPPLLFPPTITTLSSSFLTLNAVHYSSMKNNFCFFQNLHLFFTSNSEVFVDRGCKNISCSRAQGTLATPLHQDRLTWRPYGPFATILLLYLLVDSYFKSAVTSV